MPSTNFRMKMASVSLVCKPFFEGHGPLYNETFSSARANVEMGIGTSKKEVPCLTFKPSNIACIKKKKTKKFNGKGKKRGWANHQSAHGAHNSWS